MPILNDKSATPARRRVLLSALALVVASLAFACTDVTEPRTHPAGPALRTLIPGLGIVSPGDMHGWAYWDAEHDVACSTSSTCQLAKMVTGPTGQPAGTGSADLSVGTSGTSRKMALWTTALGGTRLSQITSLSYSSYRQSGGPGAVPIVFDVDYDLSDSDTTSAGQMIYLPTYSDTSLSPQGSWVLWNARTTGLWGGTLSGWLVHPAPPAFAHFYTNPCLSGRHWRPWALRHALGRTC